MDNNNIESRTPQQEFSFYLPWFQDNIKGKDVTILSEKIGCSVASMYNYLGGNVPDTSKCKYIVEEAIKLLNDKGLFFINTEL